MDPFLIRFSRSYNVPEKADFGEKLGDIGFGLLRIGFGHTVRVRRVELVDGQERLFFEKRSSCLIQRIGAIAFTILLFPLTLVLLGMGVLGLAISKSHKHLVTRMDTKTPEEENLRIHKIMKSQMDFTQRDNPIMRISNKHSVIYNRKTKKYVYISKAPPIKNLVISGGGAKGVILLGVFQAFEEHKVGPNLSFRDQLDHVAGSSIGAVTAALLATGMTAENMSAVTQEEDYEKLLGKGYGPILKDGKPMTRLLRKNMQKAIRDRLKKKFGDLQCTKIQTVLQALNKPSVDDVKITFSMLRTLHELDPHGFKELTVTAICRETGKTVYFDADTSPHLDIALACRASCSLPIVLSPVRIGNNTYSDGGYLDNIPVASMQNKQGKGAKNKGIKGQNLQTLALLFDGTARLQEEPSPFHNYTTKEHTLYYPSTLDRLSRDFLAKVFGGIATSETNTASKESTLELIRSHYTQRNIPLLVSLKTRDFKKAKELSSKYKQLGYQQTRKYLHIHRGELMYRTLDNLDQLSNYGSKKLVRISKQFFSPLLS